MSYFYSSLMVNKEGAELGCLIPPLCHQFIVQPSYLVTYSIRSIGKVFFSAEIFFLHVPPRGVQRQNSLQFIVSKMPPVGSLNLCLWKPDSMQKKSAQSDHPTWRKQTKCGPNLLFWAIVKISQYFCTFWTFSLGRVIGLS